MTEIIHLGAVRYEINDDHVASVFPDGSVCHGVFTFTDEDEARARALGYHGSSDQACWRMHRDHDLAHHLVAQALGWSYSQVLHMAAQGATSFPVGVYATEERMAFLVARAANVGVRGLVE